MKENEKKRISVLSLIYAAICIGFFVYLIAGTDLENFLGSYENAHRIDFSDGWKDAAGNNCSLQKLPVSDAEGLIVISKALPGGIQDGEALNIISHNIRFSIELDGEEIYSYYPEENLTGQGTGDIYHNIAVSRADERKVVEIHIQLPYVGESGGRFNSAVICSTAGFYHLIFRENALSFIVSLLIIFLGLAIIMLHFAIYRENQAGYNLTALGIAAILIGSWTLIETGVLQILIGTDSALRVMDYICLPLMEYPVAVFINSIVKKKNDARPRIVFVTMCATLASVLIMRLGFGIDMHDSIAVFYVSYLVTIAVMLLSLAENRKYCRENNIPEELEFFYVGAVCFCVGGLIDIIHYSAANRAKSNNGGFVRIGLFIFILTMFYQIVRWITKERKTNRRDAFINSLMQYSLSAPSTEEAIPQMLEYLGKELNAQRSYIFEAEQGGTAKSSYQWFGKESEDNGHWEGELPYAEVVERLYREYDKNGSMVVTDSEKLKDYAPILYRLLSKRGVRSMITAPIKRNGEYAGFFGVSNLPEGMLEEAGDVVQYLQYFLSENLELRDNERKLVRYSYYDQMTGTKNRRALSEFEQHELDKSAPFGFIMCDINGLKRVNDTEGHEAGDAMIMDVAQSLSDVLGADVVFRMGGDEFAAYVLCDSEAEFTQAIDSIRALIAQRGRSASMGYIFCAKGSEDIEGVKKQADVMMYADKERYYAGRNDRRQR